MIGAISTLARRIAKQLPNLELATFAVVGDCWYAYAVDRIAFRMRAFPVALVEGLKVAVGMRHYFTLRYFTIFS